MQVENIQLPLGGKGDEYHSGSWILWLWENYLLHLLKAIKKCYIYFLFKIKRKLKFINEEGGGVFECEQR